MTKGSNLVSQKVVNSFLDRGDGVIEFPNGLVITDDSMMWSGTKYDIESLDIADYPGQLTLDHIDSIGGDSLIGIVEGVRKQGNKVTVDRIRYAVNASENARRAYELLRGGFSKAFSIETIGPWENDEDHTMYNHKLVGLSQVVMGNNKHAVANSISSFRKSENAADGGEDDGECSAVHEVRVELKEETQVSEGEEVDKTIEAQEAAPEVVENEVVAQEATDDTEVVEESKEEIAEEVTEETAEATEPVEDAEATEETDEAVETEEASETVEAENAIETEEATPEVEEVAPVIEEAAPAEAEADKVDEDAEPEVPAGDKEEEQEATEPVADDTDEEKVADPATEEDQINTNNNLEEDVMTKEEITKLINEAVKEVVEAQAAPVVEEPAIEEATEAEADNSYSLEKHANLALKAIRTRSASDYEALNKINEKNLNALKAAGKVSNSITIADFGNFVLPPEQWKEIMGRRTDYTPLIEATDWRETDRLEFAWLTRSGDISMSNVAACEARPAVNPDTSNLKPIRTYGAVVHTEHMEHLGAVTPVCSAATKYLVVDLIADAIAGYRNDYDRKRAELVVAKLQEAVNISGNKVRFDTTASDENKLKSFIAAMRELGDATANGVFLFNFKTLLKIMEYITPRESALGDRAFDAGKDGIRRIFGVPYVVVPNNLMPTLDDDAADNPVISFLPTGASSEAPENITITSPVFYGDLSQFVGYTSGGLQLDMTEYAAYETDAGVVRSAYQRDEVVLRGYFWRGAAYKLPELMAAITNEELSA